MRSLPRLGSAWIMGPSVVACALLLISGCVSKPLPPSPASSESKVDPAVPATSVKPVEPESAVPAPLVQKEGLIYGARPAGRGMIYIHSDRRRPVPTTTLFYYDLESKSERIVATSGLPGGKVDTPAADWPWVVWLDWTDSGSWRLMATNLQESGPPRVISEYKHNGTEPTDEVYPSIPSISGNQVVWSQLDEMKRSDIYLVDLKEMKRSRLTTGSMAGRAEIAGDTVVFTCKGLLCSLGLTSREVKELTRNTVGDFSYGGGDFAVFVEVEPTPEGARQTLYQLRLSTGESRQIAPQTSPGHDYFIAAGTKHAVWQLTGVLTEASRFHVQSFDQPDRTRALVAPGVEKVGGVRHPYMLREQLAWVGSLGPDQGVAYIYDLGGLKW